MTEFQLPKVNEEFEVAHNRFVYIRGGIMMAGDRFAVTKIDENQQYHLKIVGHGPVQGEGRYRKMRIGKEWTWSEKTFKHKLKTLERVRKAE